jgi:protein gp37
MKSTKIEWTQTTWNPTTGCTKVSSGCKNCYAESMAKRLHSMGIYKYRNSFDLTMHEELITEPYSWKKPRMVFVNSMSDLFHEDICDDFIFQVFKTMNENRGHIFQVLTKRSARLLSLSEKLKWTPNIWMGVTVEDIFNCDRIDNLIKTQAQIKFLSCEPLLSPLENLNLKMIDWVIVGGESGRNARPINKSWVINIKEQCFRSSVPFFFKQWGGTNKKKNGRTLEGSLYNEMPKCGLKTVSELFS